MLVGGQAEFSRKLGTTPQYVQKWVGKTPSVPGGEWLARIVSATGCSAAWLLTGEGEPYPQPSPETPVDDDDDAVAEDAPMRLEGRYPDGDDAIMSLDEGDDRLVIEYEPVDDDDDDDDPRTEAQKAEYPVLVWRGQDIHGASTRFPLYDVSDDSPWIVVADKGPHFAIRTHPDGFLVIRTYRDDFVFRKAAGTPPEPKAESVLMRMRVWKEFALHGQFPRSGYLRLNQAGSESDFHAGVVQRSFDGILIGEVVSVESESAHQHGSTGARVWFCVYGMVRVKPEYVEQLRKYEVPAAPTKAPPNLNI